jgi:hypothetical protein
MLFCVAGCLQFILIYVLPQNRGTETLNEFFKGGMVRGGIENVVCFLHPITVGELQVAAFSLVAGRIGVRRILRKVQNIYRLISTTTVVREKEPGPFLLLQGVVKLELRIRDSAKFRVGGRRLRPVGMADDMDQSVAGVDLVSKHLSEIPGLGTKNILIHGRETFFFQDLGDACAYLPSSCATHEM